MQKTKITPMGGGVSQQDLDSLFPGASTGMAIIYRGLAGWVADFVATTDISDIDLTGVAARSLLVYDLASKTFKAGYINVADLADVDLTGLAAGNLLMWDGAHWHVVPPPTAAGEVLVSTSLLSASWAMLYGMNYWATADHTPLETNDIVLSKCDGEHCTVVEDYDVTVA